MKTQDEQRQSFRCGPYSVDGHARQIQLDGKRIDLSATSFEVFYQLVENRGKTISREEFSPWKGLGNLGDSGEVFGPVYRRPVDMCVVEIRRKLNDSIIVTVHGEGYGLSPNFPVEVIAPPSATELERTMSITLSQVKEHSSRALHAAVDNCKEILAHGKIADAYAALGLAYINLGHVGFCRETPTVAIAKAREVISDALRWYPNFSSAFALRGLTSLIYDYDWASARKHFDESLRLNPSNELAHCFLSHLLVAKGSFETGLEHARIAAELDYDSRMTVITEPWLMMFAGRIDDAISKGLQDMKRFQDFAIGHIVLGHIYRSAGATAKALECYDSSLQIEFFPEALASKAYVYAQIGKRQEALKCLTDLHGAEGTVPLAYVSSYFDALVHAGLGSKDKALQYLEKSYSEKCDWLIYLEVEPRLAILRKEKRFRALCRTVGLRGSREK